MSSELRNSDALKVPCTVQVCEVVTNRYGTAPVQGEAEYALNRPLAWEARREGVDVVTTVCGQTIALRSGGGQSVPQAGWKVYLTGGSATEGYTWTLYGIPAAN